MRLAEGASHLPGSRSGPHRLPANLPALAVGLRWRRDPPNQLSHNLYVRDCLLVDRPGVRPACLYGHEAACDGHAKWRPRRGDIEDGLADAGPGLIMRRHREDCRVAGMELRGVRPPADRMGQI